MDCWIGVVQEDERRVVTLAGRLSAAHVPDLLSACDVKESGAPVEVNLRDLVAADAPGIEALRRVRRGGAHLVDAPGYIQLKIDSPRDGTSFGTDR